MVTFVRRVPPPVPRNVVFAIVVVAAIASTASTAVHAQDFTSARSLGLSEAYRSIATGNDAIYANPAGLALVPRYSAELNYDMNLVVEQHQLDASIVDSKTSPVAAGIAYTFDGRQFTKRASQQHTATLALAYPLLDKLFIVGAGFKYVNVSDAFLGNYLNALSADVGVLSRLPGGLSLAAVGYNLIPIRSARVPLSAAFAASLDLGPLSALVLGGAPQFGDVMNAAGLALPTELGSVSGPLAGLVLAFDWRANFATLYGTKSTFSGGAEYLLFDMVPLRAGYAFSQGDTPIDDDHRVSVGSGFIVPNFGLDVGYQQSVINLDVRTFAVALKFFLPV